ncbi:MAG: diguanylate cyclase [Caldimonas sp.]
MTPVGAAAVLAADARIAASPAGMAPTAPLRATALARQFVAEWIVLLLGLALVGTMIGWSLYNAHESVDTLERDRLRVQARVVDENIGQQLDGMNRALASVRDEYLATPVYSVSALLSTRLKALTDAIPGVRSMVLLDADGTVVASSVDSLLGRDFGDRDYFRAPRTGHNPSTLHVAAPYKTSLGSYTVVFARSIAGPNGVFAGAVAAALEPEYFEVLLRSVLYAPDMWVSLGHDEGRVFVTMPPDAARMEGDWQHAAAELGGLHGDPLDTPVVVAGLVAASGAAGGAAEIEPRMTALRHLRPAALHMDKPLVIAVSRALPEVFAPWRQQATTYALFFLLLSGGAAVGLYRGQWRRRSFAALEASAAQSQRQTDEKLALALQGAELGFWDWDVKADHFTFNDVARRQIGFGTDDTASDGDWRRLVHRSDGARLFAAAEAHLHGEMAALECEFRIRHQAGHWIWLLTRGKVVERDASGKPARMAGTHIDVTQRKEAMAQIERSAEMLRRTGELALIGGWELDLTTQQVAWSDQVCAIHEVEPGFVPGLDGAVDFYAAEAQPVIRAAVETAIASGSAWDLELPLVTARGNPKWVRAQGVPVIEDGRVVRLIGAFQDITERKTTALEMSRLNEQLTRLSTTDALTEVGNRRFFDQTLKTEWLRAARRGESVGLLMIDIDHFKQYNDHYGHPAGDACLRQVARMIGESVRRGGELVARYGGEEFALLLPAGELEAAKAVAERCRESVGAAKIEHRASATSAWLSISVGVASQVATPEVDCSVLVAIADAALYRAKRCGRDRVEY